MKKTLLALIIILSISTSSVSAQEFSWGVKVGANFASVQGKGADNLAPKPDFVGGLFAEVKTCDWFSVSADVLYSGQGYKEKELNLYQDLSYINVPILANFYITDWISLKVGIQFDVLLSAKIRQSISNRGDFEKMNFAVPVAIAYELECGLLFDLRYNFDITKINKGEGKMYNSVLAFTVGWRF